MPAAEKTAAVLKRGTTRVASLPVVFCGPVATGFGRGSKELGCPTANIPIEPYKEILEKIPTGVFYGLTHFVSPSSPHHGNMYPTALSIGWNPFYKNERKTIEAHLIHQFDQDFYEEEISVLVLGYIRPQWDFTSLEELVRAIKDDINYTTKQLQKEEHKEHRGNNYQTPVTSE